VALVPIYSQCVSFDESLTRTGIEQISNVSKLHFIHLTCAEFYVAEYFVKELNTVKYFLTNTRSFIL
jgi:hypothetical protein